MNEKQYYIDIVSGLAERTIKRLWIVIILLVVLLAGSNIAWWKYESSFADEVLTVTQDVAADGNSDVSLRNVGGDYYGGESETDGNN